MISRTKITPEMVADVARVATGKYFRDLKKQFHYLSDSTLYKILTENNIPYRKLHQPGTSRRTLERKQRKETSPEFFRHEDFKMF